MADCFRDGDDSGGPECVVSPLIDNLEHVFLVGGLSRGFASQDDVVLRADENVEQEKASGIEQHPCGGSKADPSGINEVDGGAQDARENDGNGGPIDLVPDGSEAKEIRRRAENQEEMTPDGLHPD